MSPSPPLEPYDTATFQHHLIQTERLHAWYFRICARARPCGTCLSRILYAIADRLASLLTMGPSEDVAEERKDMQWVDSLSRRLLPIDSEGVTGKVWVLLERKTGSLVAAAAANESAVEEAAKGRKMARRRVIRRCVKEEEEGGGEERRFGEERASVSSFTVIERQPGALSSSTAVVEREPPRASTSSFAVVEREPPRAAAPYLDTVVRQPRSLTPASSVGEWQPSTTSDNINMEQLHQPSSSPSTSQPVQQNSEPDDDDPAFEPPERAPTQTRRMMTASSDLRGMDPAAVARLVGSLNGIIAELEGGVLQDNFFFFRDR
ncbi:MAG: hypothetical protein Q9210_004043 [Variospora velana]